MLEYSEIIEKLKEVEKLEFVKTHRSGPTGIGKTLEDLLGIEENNIPGPNAEMLELKSARKNVKSLLTLFTKSPLPPSANTTLVKRFGYSAKSGSKRKRLETTVNAINFNSLKGRHGFKIDIANNRLNLITPNNEVVCYWDEETVRKSFERKYHHLLFVKAETKGKGANEEFWYNEAWLLKNFSFINFMSLLKKGIILVDIRIGQYPDGRTHDHGTSFRIVKENLDLCFENRTRII